METGPRSSAALIYSSNGDFRASFLPTCTHCTPVRPTDMDTRCLLLTCLPNVYHSLLFKTNNSRSYKFCPVFSGGSSWERISITSKTRNIDAHLLIESTLSRSDHLWCFNLDKVRWGGGCSGKQDGPCSECLYMQRWKAGRGTWFTNKLQKKLLIVCVSIGSGLNCV